jgi:predicted esterase
LALIADEIATENSVVERPPEYLDVPYTAVWISSYENPRAIEPLIKLIAQDETGKVKSEIGRFALEKLTGVRYEASHDGRWWTNWWEENKDEINSRIDRAAEPPSGNLYVPNHRRKLLDAEDVADIPAADTLIGGDERKRYVLIGPKKEAPRPADGWRLLLIMPGGSGSPDFHPFVKRIYKKALSEDYLAAQIIAPEWNRWQANKIVWPTKTGPWRGMEFSTEELIDAVIDDIQSKHPIDDRFIFTLSWSSGGPAGYAVSLDEKTRVTGTFVAMSVFHPNQLPPLSRARGHRYFLLHSPQDWIPIRMAREAERSLKENGAVVELQTYQGGHGWRDDPYGKMRTGIEWLESQVSGGEDSANGNSGRSL